jgi:acyl carrier protein
MGNSEHDVEGLLRSFLIRVDKAAGAQTFELQTPLYADGLGLDSLETAELSALLEDEFGSDPFSTDSMPQTVGEIKAFYDNVAAGT